MRRQSEENRSINLEKYEKWIGFIFLAAAAGMLILSVRLCFADGIWYDELFTMGLTGKSFGEAKALTARDVHPPFYYYYVKSVSQLCLAVFPGANRVIIGKLCSVLPLLGLAAYAVTKVKKHFGWLCAGLFLFCVIAMPNLPQYTVEIRMYTLAMFLVTAAFLHGYEILCGLVQPDRNKAKDELGQKEKKGNAGDWIFLAVYGVMAAYTHYFAAVAVAMVYLFLLVFIIGKGNTIRKNGIKSWLLCVFCSVLAYMPWMFVVIRQVAQVKESYWILPLTWRTFGTCVKFLMKPPFGSSVFQVGAAVVLFGIYVGLMLYILWKNRHNEKTVFVIIAGTGVLAGVVLFGFAASFLLRPVFIVRYMLPAAGCFWLSFAFFVSRAAREKWLWWPVLLLVLVIGIGDYRWFRNDETWRRVRMEEVQEALAQIGPEDIVITQFNQVQGVAGYYLENDMYLWNAEPEALICDIFEDKYFSLSSPEELKKWVETGKRVWFIGNKEADLLKEWEEEGILSEEKQEFMLEVYWATLYRLYLDEG